MLVYPWGPVLVVLVLGAVLVVVLGAVTTGAGVATVVGVGGGVDVLVTGGAVAVWVVDVVATDGRTTGLRCTVLWVVVVVVVVVVDDVEVDVVEEVEVAGVDAAAFELVCEAEPPPQPEIANPATIMLSNAFFIDATPVRSGCSPFRLQDTPGAETFRRRRARNGSPVARSAALSG